MYDILSVHLENGLQVIMHRIPHSRTMACGLWVKQGSKHECAETAGLSHLLEHLMINIGNTNNPRFQQLVSEISSEGVSYNAGTTKENTSFYFTGLSGALEKCLEALSCLTRNKIFPDALFENEKKVVLQEATSFYSSFNQIRERTTQALWGDMNVGRVIVGSLQAIRGAQREDIEKILHEAYTPENSTLVIVGGIEYDRTLSYVDRYFSPWEDRITCYKEDAVESEPGIFYNKTAGSSSSVVSIGFRTKGYNDPYRFHLEILAKVLGDSNLDSRLMQAVRMKRGLAYTVGSFFNQYELRGALGFTAVCGNDVVHDVTQVIIEELNKVKADGLTLDEVQRAKKVLETQKLLELDNLTAQLKFLGRSAQAGQLFSLESELRQLKRADDQHLQHVIHELLTDTQMGFAGIGDFDIDHVLPALALD